jgi:hypothetical protein
MSRSGTAKAPWSRPRIGTELEMSAYVEPRAAGGVVIMLKFLGTTMGIIFLIGLLVVIGLFALIF